MFKHILFALALTIQAFGAPQSVRLVSEYETIQENTPFWVALDHNLEEGWHAYWKNPGDAGMVPKIEWTLPEGFSVVEVLWPAPKKFEQDSFTTYGYDAPYQVLVKISPPSTLVKPAAIKARLEWVVCSGDTCLPGEQNLELEISKGTLLKETDASLFTKAREKIPTAIPFEVLSIQNELVSIKLPSGVTSGEFFPEKGEAESLFENDRVILKAPSDEAIEGVLVLDGKAHAVYIPLGKEREMVGMLDAKISEAQPGTETLSLVWTLLFAFAGGLLLNLMPCVLPVISLKVMSFVKMSGESRKTLFAHALSFVLGVLISFWILAATLFALKSWGHAVGWGFQLQEPLFVAIFASFLFIFSLSFFGLFEFGTNLASWAGEKSVKTKSKGVASSFFNGVFATLVATPCTGPFMGSALGAAIAMPFAKSMLVFTSLGLGMSMPYLFLALFPALLFFIPKPGNWMVRFKELMGFALLASSLWLLWVFGTQSGVSGMTLLMFAFFTFALAGWVLGTFAAPHRKASVRKIALVVALIISLFGGKLIYKAASSEPAQTETQLSDWEPFNPARVEELRKKNIPVFIDFTASWCLICQANHAVLSTPKVTEAMEKKGVVRMKADWTRKDAVIAKELEKHGRTGVPLYLLWDADGKSPTILPQTLTPDLVVEALDEKIGNIVN